MAGHVDRVGQQVGDYRLLRWLGGGGFGDVYLGEHLHEHTQVAIKVLHGRLTRHEDLKEFINEARTIHLKHRHIVSLLDFGIASDGTPFLVMTYAPHGTLRDLHPKGSRLPLSIIVSYMRPLASALQYAHSLHLVHRDVKPENMLLGPSHEVMLSDFGIVAVVHSSRSLATEQGVSGTLPYMAPEQIAGKPRAASDQYALGIVIYEWITGRRPFTGTAAEIVAQHINVPPPSLREQLPMLPIDVERVVTRALAKDPKSRFADIEAFAKAFEQTSQQVETLKSPAEHSSTIRSPLPMQDSSSARAPAEQTNVVEPTATGTPTPFAPTPAVSFSGVEGIALITQPVDGPVATPIISPAVSELSRQEPTHSHFPPPARIEITQSLRRRRLFWKTAGLLIILALIILGSTGGLFATQHLSTAWTQESATAARAAADAADAYARFVATNGIMFGFDAQHTRVNPYERILNPTNVGGLMRKWVFQTEDHLGLSSPAVAGGVVYMCSEDGNLYALDATTGAKKWSYQTGDSIISSPAVADGVVYVGSRDHNLYAFHIRGT